MKKITSCLLLIFILMAHISCNDEYKHFTLETPPDTMELTTVQENLVLDEDLYDQVALTFEWGRAAYRGEGTEITYHFKLDIAGNNMATSIPMREISSDQLSVSFTHKELNDLITSVWGKQPGEVAELEGEVIASVTTYPQYLLPEISRATVNVTSYIPRTIFLLGTAANNEDPASAVRFTSTTTQWEYVWRGAMSVGNYRFIENQGEEFPAFYKGADNNTLVYRTQDSDPGEEFTISKRGTFVITVNTETLTVSCVSVAPDRYSELYMVGNGCPVGWDIENAIRLEWDADEAAYVYEGELMEGEIKFPTRKDWSSDSLMPPTNGARPGEDNAVSLHPGGSPDHKWYIPEAGNYRMILDVNDMKITFEKL